MSRQQTDKTQQTGEAQASPTPARHEPKTKHFRIWAPLFGHFALCLAVTGLVALKVNGYKALAYQWQLRAQPGGGYVFRDSDVTTWLSASTTLIDIVGTMWSGILAWRCVFILLETRHGLRLDHLSQILGGYAPRKRLQGREWLVTLVLLLVIPQRLIRPLFSGSVDWNFAVDYAPSIQARSGYDSASSLL
ncbi:hypothetical protein QBC33DRAFT_588842 [Phialemonium atrogriseum]|uniref:Uncharacterized protein n=1 Tax=Phialemonium atrogriseum TaxID=1093897 RepID=A0AAJ0C039_9PEZI|nr:uncharacterized protein QBC33DRAFT_588842 [Phialemonium atrogriseum]KAK1766623.1 hypothetical protein QBC33DRAFT_588842 [Phialemonium atrogriseum]